MEKLPEKAKTYHLSVFGCQMNERDAEIIAGYLEERGYKETGDPQKADLMILNTCAVRQKAEEKVYGKLGKLKKFKEDNPDMLIVVAGCMPQQEEVGKKIKSRYPYVDMVIGTHNLSRFPELLDRALGEKETVLDIWEGEGPVVEGLPLYRRSKLKAWVNITYGCNNFCSYCIVPYVRGRERSRQVKDIVAEIEELAGKGFVEVTLLGQNVNSYGRDLQDGTSFAGLLLALEEVEGIGRFRYMTSHPRDFTPHLVEIIRDAEKVCEHFHLPVQAGSNGILKKMNRGYTREHYRDLVHKVRREIPGASITTDFIVGFPGETEADFQETLDLVREIRFDAAFTFIYSPRRGTPAANMPGQVKQQVKKERIYRLIEEQNAISLEINRGLLGQKMEVLVEGESKNAGGELTGRTRTHKVVNFQGSRDLIGQFVEVTVKEAQTWSLTGQL